MKKFLQNRKKLVIIEAAILVLILLSGLVLRCDKTFTAENFNYFSGYYDGTSAYIDNNQFPGGIFVYTDQMKLGHGYYNITINYTSESNSSLAYISLPDVMNSVMDVNNRYYTNTISLPSYKNSVEAQAFVNYGSKNYIVAAYFGGEGFLKIDSISVHKTYGSTLRLFIEMLLLISIVNLCIEFLRKKKAGEITSEAIQSFFIMTAAVVLSSIPLLLNYLIKGHDLTFHLLRIEGIVESLKMGVFPDKIQPNWLEGNGYAVSVFYGDLLLYIPAVLRLCGFTVYESYNIFVFLINAVTAACAYFSFKGMIKNKRVAAVGSFLYTLSLYRLIDMYMRSSVGEYSALIFLPVLIYGLYKIFTEDIHSEGYKKNWLLPVIAFTGIINTHILTCEMAGAFTILCCLVFIKKTFRKETFIVLLKTVFISLLVNLAFFVPLVDFMVSDTYILTTTTLFEFGIQQFGAFIGQLLVPFAGNAALTSKLVDGMAGEMPVSMGLSLILCLIMFVYAVINDYGNTDSEKKVINVRTGWLSFSFAFVSLVFSTYFFPWDTIMSWGGVFNTIVTSLQFPWRFLATASVFASVCGIIALDYLYRTNKETCKVVAASLLMITFVQSGMLISNVMNNASPFIAYAPSAINTCDIVGAEYLPASSETIAFTERYVIASPNLVCEEISRENNDITLHVECDQTDGIIVTSLVNYKGYKAVDMASGMPIEIKKTDSNAIGLVIPANYSGDIHIWFDGFWYWTLAYIVSFLSIVAAVLSQLGLLDKFFTKLNKNNK